jgi:catalase
MPQASDADLANQLVASLRSAFGNHRARAAHAKGIIVEGRFTPTAEGRTLSTAAIFTKPSLPVTARFSDSTGLPDIADTDDNARPHGLGLRLHGGDGANLDLVSHSFNGFPAATAAEFAEFLKAVVASGPGVAKPTPLDTFLASHPIAVAFLTTQKPPPVSFATTAYYGVNAIALIDAAGRRTHVRHRIMPTAGEHSLDAATRAKMGPNYLQEEIAHRLAAGPASFDWFVQVAEAGDALDNPAVAWPESRQLVRVGTIEIERVAADQSRADKTLVFGPGLLPAGMEGADPMLKIRDAAYLISMKGRQ